MSTFATLDESMASLRTRRSPQIVSSSPQGSIPKCVSVTWEIRLVDIISQVARSGQDSPTMAYPSAVLKFKMESRNHLSPGLNITLRDTSTNPSNKDRSRLAAIRDDAIEIFKLAVIMMMRCPEFLEVRQVFLLRLGGRLPEGRVDGHCGREVVVEDLANGCAAFAIDSEA